MIVLYTVSLLMPTPYTNSAYNTLGNSDFTPIVKHRTNSTLIKCGTVLYCQKIPIISEQCVKNAY